MSDRTIDDLKANPMNPRKMMKDDAESLGKGMDKFGDLSCIVFNIQTGQLVGGHQRINTINRLGGRKEVQITQRFDPQTEDGTTALGYVIFNKKPFAYREVNWNPTWEAAANIAANRVQGQFDRDLLAEVTYGIQQEQPDLLELTGQKEDEIKSLLKSAGIGDDDEPSQETEDKEPRLVFKITAAQKELIKKTIDRVKLEQDLHGADDESINGQALVHFVETYLSVVPQPAVDDTFTPPEIPAL